MNKDKRLAHWRANLRLVAFCLVIWFTVSFGFGVIGMCLNFVVAIAVIYATKAPPEHIQHMVEQIRVPRHMEIES